MRRLDGSRTKTELAATFALASQARRFLVRK
jgi:hypothetical protein